VSLRSPIDRAPSPRAVQTLEQLLEAPDLIAALSEREADLDQDLLDLVRLNADTARADGDDALAGGLDALAAYVADVVSARAGTVAVP
jgi:hypothetical protein